MADAGRRLCRDDTGLCAGCTGGALLCRNGIHLRPGLLLSALSAGAGGDAGPVNTKKMPCGMVETHRRRASFRLGESSQVLGFHVLAQSVHIISVVLDVRRCLAGAAEQEGVDVFCHMESGFDHIEQQLRNERDGEREQSTSKEEISETEMVRKCCLLYTSPSPRD